MKREHVPSGRAFCDTVVELTDEATLARMWARAESMPSLARDRGAAAVARPHRREPGPSRGVRVSFARPMAAGELVAANGVDRPRVGGVRRRGVPTASTCSDRPGSALPFTIYRAWKVPTGS